MKHDTMQYTRDALHYLALIGVGDGGVGVDGRGGIGVSRHRRSSGGVVVVVVCSIWGLLMRRQLLRRRHIVQTDVDRTLTTCVQPGLAGYQIRCDDFHQVRGLFQLLVLGLCGEIHLFVEKFEPPPPAKDLGGHFNREGREMTRIESLDRPPRSDSSKRPKVGLAGLENVRGVLSQFAFRPFVGTKDRVDTLTPLCKLQNLS